MAAFEPQQIDALRALAFGFAFAGFAFSAFRYVTDHPPSFEMLHRGGWSTLLSLPLVMVTAPFIILRNTIRGRRYERRSMIFVWLATVIACLWGMAAGATLLKVAGFFLA